MRGDGGRLWWQLAFILLLIGAYLAGSFHGAVRDSSIAAYAGRVILYYRDPMHPSYTSDKPGIAPDCGMLLEPVYADEAGLSPKDRWEIPVRGKTQQLMGVVRGSVERGPLTKTIRALGRIAIDEARLFPVIAGGDGVVRKVFSVSTNTAVKKGQPLVAVYGREYVTAQRTLLYSLRAMETAPQTETLDYQDRPAFAVEEAGLALLDMGFGESQIEQVKRTRRPLLDVNLVAPENGILMTRNASVEQRFARGTELFRIADLNRVWVLADLHGEDVRLIRAGASAAVSPAEAPRNKSRAVITDALPVFNPNTRVFTVRLAMDNPGLHYQPEMFVDVEFSFRTRDVTSVPAEAVLDSGLRKTVFVDLGNGNFEPRPVETGEHFDDRVEIVNGLQPGESIVISGNFLLDAESRLKPAAIPSER